MAKNLVIVGAQWGDEGKGKIVDILTESADIVVRFQGGNNAGHTVIVGSEKYIFTSYHRATHPGDRVIGDWSLPGGPPSIEVLRPGDVPPRRLS
jgi:hypothetical protein